MARISISVLGLYQERPTLFDKMQLPAEISKQTLVENLVSELAEMEVLYADAEFMENMLAPWSAKQLPIWEKLVATTLYEYDPISNYDRHEEYSDTIEDDGSTTGNNSGSATSKVAPYNTLEMRETSGATSSNESSTTASNTRTITHSATISGNIGVTTTQEMIEAERNVVLFSVYDHIISDFKTRFCIMVY